MLEKIQEVMSKYSAEDYEIFKNTVDMLCSKGVGNGCYQDYTVLMDVISILSICENHLKEG